MTIDDKIRDGKLQYSINREAAEISTLSSGKVDKYELINIKLNFHKNTLKSKQIEWAKMLECELEFHIFNKRLSSECTCFRKSASVGKNFCQ